MTNFIKKSNHFPFKICFSEIGDVFCTIGVRELQKTASEAFCQFGEYHRQMEKYGIKMLKATKPVESNTYCNSGYFISGKIRKAMILPIFLRTNKETIFVSHEMVKVLVLDRVYIEKVHEVRKDHTNEILL